MALNSRKTPNDQRRKLIHAIVIMQEEILREAEHVFEESFETQFLNISSFKELCFLVVCHRMLGFSNDLLWSILKLMKKKPSDYTETIENFFSIHDSVPPENLIDVVAEISRILSTSNFS